MKYFEEEEDKPCVESLKDLSKLSRRLFKTEVPLSIILCENCGFSYAFQKKIISYKI